MNDLWTDKKITDLADAVTEGIVKLVDVTIALTEKVEKLQQQVKVLETVTRVSR